MRLWSAPLTAEDFEHEVAEEDELFEVRNRKTVDIDGSKLRISGWRRGVDGLAFALACFAVGCGLVAIGIAIGASY